MSAATAQASDSKKKPRVKKPKPPLQSYFPRDSAPTNCVGKSHNTSALFSEYLRLKVQGGRCLKDLLDASREVPELGPEDALVVVDMQNDRVADDARSWHGAAPVPEARAIAGRICRLMDMFSARGARVAASRGCLSADHPCSRLGDHVSEDCVEGTEGSQFYRPIRACLAKLLRLGRAVDIVFKRRPGARFGKLPMRSSVLGLTSPAVLDNNGLDCSASSNGAEPAEDVLHLCCASALEGVVDGACRAAGESIERLDLDVPPSDDLWSEGQTLEARFKEVGVRRVFVCGVALDGGVLETALAAAPLFEESFLVLDLCRPTYCRGQGHFGSGFWSSPSAISERLAGAGVTVIESRGLLEHTGGVQPLGFAAAFGQPRFPHAHGSLQLVAAKGLRVAVDLKGLTYSIVGPRWLQDFARNGTFSPPVPINCHWSARTVLGIPQCAAYFCWAYPNREVDWYAFAQLPIISPLAGFIAFGGFLFLDLHGKVMLASACAAGCSDLEFCEPRPWTGAGLSLALATRWRPVLSPALRDSGARLYAWLGPRERIRPAKGERLKVGKFGGFAYLFHENLDETDPRDTLFDVASWCGTRGEASRCWCCD